MTARSDTGPFTTIPEWVLYADVDAHAVRLYGVLDRHSDRNGVSWPSRATLARLMQCSLSTLDRAKRELVGIGALLVEPRIDNGQQHSNNYTLIRRDPAFLTPPLVTGDQHPLVTGDQQNESHVERDSRGGGGVRDDATPTEADAPTDPVRALVAGFVDDWRVVHGKHDPPRQWRSACGAAARAALADGEDVRDVAACLGVCANENKIPNTNNLRLVLADKHAGRPRKDIR